jgi:hypothetical protein
LHRNCLLSHIIEGKIIGTRRQGRRCKQLLNDLKEARRYWKLKEEAQDRTLWRTQFRRGYGPVTRQTYYLNLKQPVISEFPHQLWIIAICVHATHSSTSRIILISDPVSSTFYCIHSYL